MNGDNLRKLYDNVSKEYELPDYETFSKDMQNEDNLKKFYSAVSADYELPEYEVFVSDMGLKKKEPTSQGSSTPSTPSAPSGKESKIRELTVKATDAQAKGDMTTVNSIKAQIEQLNKAKLPNLPQSQEPTTPTDLRALDTTMPTEQRGATIEPKLVGDTKAKAYQMSAPNSMERLNIGELRAKEEAIRKQQFGEKTDKDSPVFIQKQEFGTTPEYESVKNELNTAFANLENDYLSYLEFAEPDKFSQYQDRLQTINQQDERTATDEAFLRQFRDEALEARENSDRNIISTIKNTTDLKGYENKMSILAQDAKNLNAQYAQYQNEDGTPKSPLAAQKLQELNSKAQDLQAKQDAIKQETGVTDDVQDLFIAAHESLTNINFSREENTARFPNLNTQEGIQAYQQSIKDDIAKNGSTGQKAALLGLTFMNSIGEGVTRMGQAPKVIADALGYGDEAGFTDVLYDLSTDILREKSLSPTKDASTLYKLGETFSVGAGNVVQFAAGGEVTSGLKMSTNAGIVGTAFLMSEGQNYQEALDAGLPTQQAALFATMISLAEAYTETIVPDTKYFDASARRSITEAIKNGKGVKEAVGDYFTSIVKSGLKEAGEETLTEFTGDVVKETLNAATQESIYKDTFNPESYYEAALAGLVTGGGMSMFQRAKKSPIQKETQRQIAENANVIMPNIAEVAPEVVGEVAGEIDEMSKINNGLKNVPAYQGLENAEKDEVFDLLLQKSRLKQAMTESGIQDEVTKRDIEDIDAKVNAIYSGKKVGETVEVETEEGETNRTLEIGEVIKFEDAPSQIDAGTTVEFDNVQPTNVVEETPVVEETDVLNTENKVETDVTTTDTQAGIEVVESTETTPVEVENVQNVQSEVDALKDVESTARVLEGVDKKMVEIIAVRKNIKPLKDMDFGDEEANANWKKVQDEKNRLLTDDKYLFEQIQLVKDGKKSSQTVFEAMYGQDPRELNKTISEAYHAAKADGSNPELVQAVESLLGQLTNLQEGVEGQPTTLQEPLSENTQSIEQNVETPIVEETTTENVETIESSNEQVPPTEPPVTKGELDFESTKGEEREAARGKRIDANKKYKEKLTDYVKTYTSVSIELVNKLVDDYMDTYRQDVSELGVREANEQALAFFNSLLMEDISSASGGNQNFSRSAFAMIAAQRILQDALAGGDLSTTTMFNDFLDLKGRLGGTIIATLNSQLGTDPLLNLVQTISKVQSEALKKKAKSGRTKKEVVDDIVEEVNAAKKDAVDALENDETLEKDITTVTSKSKPKEERKVTPSKRTELNNRKKAALEKLKSLRDSNVGFAASPKEQADKSGEFAEALIELAKVQIQLGAYTLSEAVSKVYKDITKNGLPFSKKQIENVISSVWESQLLNFSNEARIQEATDILSEAIEGKNVDAVIKGLAKAIRIVNPEFIKAQKKGRRISDKQAVEEILQNKEQAELLLAQALEHIRQEIAISGKYLDSVKAKKPATMSDEQWDALRAKAVFNRYRMFVDTILGNVEAREDNLMLLEDEKQRAKEVTKAVREVASKFYKEPNNTQSFAEALMEKLPFLTLEQAIELQEKVENRIEKLVEQRDNRRIKNLVKEITEGKDEADLNKVIAKTMWNRGAMSSPQFANLISTFLGYKGVPQNVITQLLATFNQVKNAPSGLAKQTLMRSANNLAQMYSETSWAFLSDVFKEIIVRSTLSSAKTGFSGGLSVFVSSIPSYVGKMIVRPVKGARATAFVVKQIFSGRYAMASAARETFREHRTAIGRELPREENPYAKDRAWARARNTKWKEIGNIWKTDKGKAISYVVAKTLINFTFQGKYLGSTNWVYDFMGFLDYLNITALRDINLAIDAQRKMDVKALKASGVSISKELENQLKVSDADVARYEQEIQDEITTLTNQGLPVPKNYASRRMIEKINEARAGEELDNAHEKALRSTMMNEPKTAIGNTIYSAFKGIQEIGNPKVAGQMNMIGFVVNQLTFPITLFSRIAIVLGEAGSMSVPLFNVVVNAIPYEFNLKGGFPALRRDKDGNPYLKGKDDMRDYTARMVAATSISAFFIYLLSEMFDDEEVVNPDGEFVINPETNKPYVRKKYKWSGYIDFYGNDPKVAPNEKGMLPRNVMRIYTGVDEFGNKTYVDRPMELATPWGYPFVKALGEMRDAQRYSDDVIVAKLTDEKEVNYALKNADWNMMDYVSASAANCFSADFSAISAIGRGIAAEKGVQTTVERILIDPNKRLISPRSMENMMNQFQQLNGQRKTFMKLNLEDANRQDMIDYLMKDMWFTDPFIQDREKYESVDYFGNKIDFPPVYDNFWGMFGTSTTYMLSNHENKHKDQYQLFRDDKGEYNPDVLPFPKRYIPSSITVSRNGESVTVKPDSEVKRLISDGAYANFGEYVNENIDNINSMSYEYRVSELAYYWDMAKYDIIVELFPETTRKAPKYPKNGVYQSYEDDKIREDIISTFLSSE